MKFISVEDSTETSSLAQEYKGAREIGVVRLGETCLFFKKLFRIYFIPYKCLSRAYRRVLLVPAKMCCGSGDLPVENLVIHNSKDEEVAVVSMPGAKAAVILLEELKVKSPETVTVCPEKPKPPKKPGKSEKSLQASKSKSEKSSEVEK
ncbi:MAG: hypothetical protein MJ188_10145 [Treponema sp.]|nr:hypothetical protein [Treponema sp.]